MRTNNNNNKKMNNKRKLVLYIILIFILLNIIACFAITKIIYDSAFPRYTSGEVVIPDELAGMVANRGEVTFESGKNTLQGYLYSENSRQELAKWRDEHNVYEHKNVEQINEDLESGLVVIVPGINAGVEDYLWQTESFLEYGWDVFIFDTTGSCNSEGKSLVGFSQELYDLDAALDYIEANYEYDNTFLFGHSRGGYSACGMLDSEHDVTAVVSVSGLNSAMEAVMEPAVKNMGKAAYGNYPMLWFYNVLLFDVKTVQMRASEEIADSQIPTVIVQGTKDDVALMDQYSIYAHKEEMNSGNVEYYICDIPGQNGHTDLMFDPDGSANDDLMKYLNEFFYDVTLQD